MNQLLQQVTAVAASAGEEILSVYDGDFDVEIKGDGSPLTVADQRSHTIIARELARITPEIPMLSEESGEDVFRERLGWSRYWLVDPLDGTKEFVSRNGEFTVNIALIEHGEPVLGVVHTPVQGVTHLAARGVGAFKSQQHEEPVPISVREPKADSIIMVASRSHAGPEVEAYKSRVENDLGPVSITSMGSSLKLCLVAEGSADIYPRLGPTSEWDTAAAHCVVDVAGGRVTGMDGESLRYNKENILNPWFLVSGGGNIDWPAYFAGKIPG